MFCVTPCLPHACQRLRLTDMATERIEQFTVCGGVHQRAVVVLPVDLDQHPTNGAQQRHAGGLVVDEDTAATVGGLDAPQDEVAAVVVEAVLPYCFAC